MQQPATSNPRHTTRRVRHAVWRKQPANKPSTCHLTPVTCLFGLLMILILPMRSVAAELTMKILVVNPSENEVKEFHIRSPLPPEVKPEHVLEAGGLSVEYDSQAGTYFLVGSVTLKPKASVTRKVVLEDVWVIPADRLTSLRREVDEITEKLTSSSYAEQGRVLASAILRNLSMVEMSQAQPLLNPQQHISLYRDNLKTLQMVESDLVSLRQLMVMAALGRPSQSQPLVAAGETTKNAHERGQLSVLATWRLIFVVLGLLGFVSLSFFLVWQRQLKLQLAKQALHDAAAADSTLTNGHEKHPALPADLPQPVASRIEPKTPLSSP